MTGGSVSEPRRASVDLASSAAPSLLSLAPSPRLHARPYPTWASRLSLQIYHSRAAPPSPEPLARRRTANKPTAVELCRPSPIFRSPPRPEPPSLGPSAMHLWDTETLEGHLDGRHATQGDGADAGWCSCGRARRMLAGGGISTPSLRLGMGATYELYTDTTPYPRANGAGGGSSTTLTGMIRGVFSGEPAC